MLDEGVLSKGVLAPQQGITHDPKGDATALVVDAQGKVEEREVKVSRTVGNQWLVDDGLGSGRSRDRGGAAEGAARHAR